VEQWVSAAETPEKSEFSVRGQKDGSGLVYWMIWLVTLAWLPVESRGGAVAVGLGL
jgi:hypothetical protein